MKWMISIVLGILQPLALTFPQQAQEISGAFAVTDIVRFDYDRDGNRNRVQFWLEIQGLVAEGKAGEAENRPGEGWIKYYMLDIDKNEKVFEWNIPLDMGGPPPDKTYPLQNLVVDGNTARFEAFNMKWTIVDGGRGIDKDTITVDDGFRPRSRKFRTGNIYVGPAKALTPAKKAPCD